MNRYPKKSISVSINQLGFTLIELMIVVSIIGILTAFAFPSYQRHAIKTKRTDMMSEMQNIASQIQARKLARGSYSNDLKVGLGGSYPTKNPLYTVVITPDPLTSEWMITAHTIDGKQMDGDGILSLNYQNNKCRGSVCGTGNEWN